MSIKPLIIYITDYIKQEMERDNSMEHDGIDEALKRVQDTIEVVVRTLNNNNILESQLAAASEIIDNRKSLLNVTSSNDDLFKVTNNRILSLFGALFFKGDMNKTEIYIQMQFVKYILICLSNKTLYPLENIILQTSVHTADRLATLSPVKTVEALQKEYKNFPTDLRYIIERFMTYYIKTNAEHENVLEQIFDTIARGVDGGAMAILRSNILTLNSQLNLSTSNQILEAANILTGSSNVIKDVVSVVVDTMITSGIQTSLQLKNDVHTILKNSNTRSSNVNNEIRCKDELIHKYESMFILISDIYNVYQDIK